MNARVFLVLAVHEIAVAAELAIAARATEEADTYTLTNVPTSHAGADCVDPPDNFMAWDTRPINRKQGFHSTGIGMANPARLHANTHLTGARIDQRFHYGFEFSRSRHLDCSIRCTHIVIPWSQKCNTPSKSTTSGAIYFKALRKQEMQMTSAASKWAARCHLSSLLLSNDNELARDHPARYQAMSHFAPPFHKNLEATARVVPLLHSLTST